MKNYDDAIAADKAMDSLCWHPASNLPPDAADGFSADLLIEITPDDHEIDWPQFFTGYYSNGENQSEGWKIYGIDSSGSTIGTPIDSDRIIRWAVQTDAIKEYAKPI